IRVLGVRVDGNRRRHRYIMISPFFFVSAQHIDTRGGHQAAHKCTYGKSRPEKEMGRPHEKWNAEREDSKRELMYHCASLAIQESRRYRINIAGAKKARIYLGAHSPFCYLCYVHCI